MSLMQPEKSFNKEWLQITDLPKGQYQFSIDGLVVESFTDKQLGAGINLNGLQTPQLQQAKAVETLCFNYLTGRLIKNVKLPIKLKN